MNPSNGSPTESREGYRVGGVSALERTASKSPVDLPSATGRRAELFETVGSQGEAVRRSDRWIAQPARPEAATAASERFSLTEVGAPLGCCHHALLELSSGEPE